MAKKGSGTAKKAKKPVGKRKKNAKNVGKRVRPHAARQKRFRSLGFYDEKDNSQGSQRSDPPVKGKNSSARSKTARERAARYGYDRQQRAMRLACDHHRVNQAKAPGSDDALKAIQRRRGTQKLFALHQFLTDQQVTSRSQQFENISCWYMPHGPKECKELPKAFMICVAPKKTSPSQLFRHSEAWVLMYSRDDVYCADAKHVFVTKGSLVRKSLIGPRAKGVPQEARMPTSRREAKKIRFLKTRNDR
jgi:hypothetical protein